MKVFRNLSLIIIALFVVLERGFSQTTDPKVFDIKTMLPTSPEAAMLGRFGDIPIGYYTGTADISIPLYTIKESGLEIPIVLRYHSSGIKVEDQATNVGLGWSLEPGGAIIQIVNGVEDTYDHLVTHDPAGYVFLKQNIPVTGVVSSRTEIGDKVWPCLPGPVSDIGDSQATIHDLLDGHGQPDIYQYSFPGRYSGKFYINPETHEVVLIDKKDEISFVKTGSNWIATTLDGNKYYFSDRESVSADILTNYTGFTWKLSRIELNTGKVITFDYQDGYYEWETYGETYHSEYPLSLNPASAFNVQEHSSISRHNTKNLVKITSEDAIVVFNQEDRQDLQGRADNDGIDSNGTLSVKRIKSVDIISKATNRKIKSYNFSYDYFPYSTIGGNWGTYIPDPEQTNLDFAGKRLKLLSVQENGYTSAGQSQPRSPYKFYYNESVPLPLKTSFARDFWGYYNGKNNPVLIPDLSFFYYSGHYSTIPANLLTIIHGANRTPDTALMKSGLLNKIVYPTGGFTEFDYEPHTFSNYNYPDVGKIGSTIKTTYLSDMNEANDIASSEHFTLPRAMTIHFTNRISAGYLGQGLDFYDLEGSTIKLVKVINSNVTILKTWQMNTNDKATFEANNNNFTWETDYDFTYDPNAYYVVSVNLPNELGQQNDWNKGAAVSSSFSYPVDTVGNYKISYGGGVRVSGIRNYTGSGKMANEKIFSYTNTNNTSSGILMSPLDNLYSRRMYFEKKEDLGSDGSFKIWGQYATIWFISSESATPFSDAAGGNIVGYSRVEEKEVSADGGNNGKHVYYYFNNPSATAVNTPEDPNLLNGKIDNEEVYNSSGILLKKTNYTYSNKLDITFTGIKAFELFFFGYECGFPAVPSYQYADYLLMHYPINSKWYVLSNKKTSEFLSSDTLTTTEDYDYNSIGQLIKTTSYNSENKKTVTEFLYPVDDSISTDAALLRSGGLWNNLLQKKAYLNDSEISRVKLSYNLYGGQIVQSETERSNKGAPLYQEVTFDKYGPNKSLLQFTQKGVISSLIWSDNNAYTIAEIENAENCQCAYTSFENYQKGNWSYSEANIDTTIGKTGVNSFNLNNSQVSQSGLNASKSYIVSYWSRSTTPYNVTGTQNTPVPIISVDGWSYFEHLVTGVTTISVAGTGLIDELRLYPQNAQMTTYTYRPLIGVTSQTNPRGQTVYYEYDDYDRLKAIKDEQGNIIKAYDYHYKP